MSSSRANRRTAISAVVAIALGVAVPVAGARPIDTGPTYSGLPSGAPAATSVYSRADHSLVPVSPPTASAAGVARTAAAGSQRDRQRVAALSAYRQGQLAASFDVVAPAANAASAQAVHAPQNGFDWGDAGLGAAGGLALSLFAAGGVFVASGRRSRRSTALPS